MINTGKCQLKFQVLQNSCFRNDGIGGLLFFKYFTLSFVFFNDKIDLTKIEKCSIRKPSRMPPCSHITIIAKTLKINLQKYCLL